MVFIIFSKGNNHMEHAEYKKILDESMVDYINNGGSVYYMSNVIKEYIFEYEDEIMAYETRRRLEDKAILAMMDKKRLPDGIRLKKCIWHGKDR